MIHSVVIVGAGHAGFQVAAYLRQDGFQGDVTLVGNEPGLPYKRPPLSKTYMTGAMATDALYFRPAKYFAEQHINLMHDEVVAIDRTNDHVALKSGGTLPYEHLVLAVGAHNRPLPVPGAQLDGVFGLRTLADADRLAPRLKSARNVIVVGAGFIGLEFASVAKAAGASVHVLELSDRAMARGVSHEMADFFRQAHERDGVRMDFREGLAQVVEGTGEQQGKVVGVLTTRKRELPADIVVFGIGVLPNVQLASEAGLDIENGVRVDSHLLTSDPKISTIGDSAFFPSPYAAGFIRLEAVQNAVDQGRTVAARITGKPAAYEAVPWFWTDQGPLKLQIAGILTGYDTTVVVGRPEDSKFSVLCFRRGHLAAVESLNHPGDHMAARRILARTPTLSPNDAAAPGFELKAWEAASK